MNPCAALSALPTGVALNAPGVGALLRELVTGVTEKHRHMMIVRGLWRAEALRKQHELVQAQGRAIKVTEERACSHCNKRVGPTAFAVLDGGRLVHLGCLDAATAEMAGIAAGR